MAAARPGLHAILASEVAESLSSAAESLRIGAARHGPEGVRAEINPLPAGELLVATAYERALHAIDEAQTLAYLGVAERPSTG